MNLIAKLLFAPFLVTLVTTFNFENIAFAEETFSKSLTKSIQTSAKNKPFGYTLFTGTFATHKTTPLDPNYIITSGDKIALHTWGAIQTDEISTVDSQGNLFLPEVGAVRVGGITAGELPSTVRQKLRSVYKDGVDVYVNLLTATPASIFVTGPVKRPGQYTGAQSDSILSYLHQAGGILDSQGSYRNIRVLRKAKVIASVDLYAFLRWGQLPKVELKNGDTILVSPQSSVVNVSGDARGNYQFEFKQAVGTGRDLISIARPNPSTTNVTLSGSRNRQPWSAYLTLAQFSRTKVLDGDSVRFVTDAPSPTIGISVEGSHLGNSYFSAKRGTRLQELLDYVAIAPDEADIHNIYIKRESVAIKQRRNLEESINRLERSVLTSPTRSSAEASIRQQESALVSQLAKSVRASKQDGRVIVSENGNTSNIRLEDGDIIVIPHLSDVITISGEVNLPQTIVYAPNASISDYISRSGGFSERANPQQIIIRKPNGQTLLSGNISAGDEIIVFPKIDTKSFQFAKDVMGIIFQIAATSSAVGIL